MLGSESVWLILILALAAAGATGLTVTLARRWSLGRDRGPSVQQVHRHQAPRLGGLPLFVTLSLGVLLWPDWPHRHSAVLLLLCALPAVGVGLLEDLRGHLKPGLRLFATFVSAWLAWFFLGGELRRVDLPGFDWLLTHVWLFAFVFTAFAVGGVAHSINIIDGFNGLSSFYSVICFAAFFIVATLVGDALVQRLSLLYCAVLLGFLAWNFPFGKVFLGDAGAYFLGFSLGELSVLLVARNPAVSPWFCLLLLAYPVWDTLFSSYRREVMRHRAWSEPDVLHLHHLIYRRLVRPQGRARGAGLAIPNSMTSIYIWVLGLMCAGPALLFWNSTPYLMGFFALFVLTYSLLYQRLARFRSPRLLQIPRRRAPVAPNTEARTGLPIK